MQVKGGMGIVLTKDKILHVLLKHGWKEVHGDFFKERMSCLMTILQIFSAERTAQVHFCHCGISKLCRALVSLEEGLTGSEWERKEQAIIWGGWDN
jgi:hypothetical protein